MKLQLIFIWLFVLTLAQGGIIENVEVNAAIYVGTTTTSIAFILSNLQNPIPVDGTIQIIFPNTFSLPQQITLVTGIGLKEGATATISGNQVIVKDGYPYSQDLISFALWKGANDPNGIKTWTNNTRSITIGTFDKQNNLIDSISNVSIDVELSALQSVKYQSDNSYTNAVSNLNIEFQAVNSIASAVSIKLKIPAHNPYSQESTLFDLISCSQNQEYLNCGREGDYLVIKDVFPTGVGANTNFSFQVQKILNPNSLKPLGNFDIYLFDGEDYFAKSEGGTLTISNPSVPSSVNISSSNKAISGLTNLTVQVWPNGFIGSDFSLRITFPADLDLDSLEIVGGRKTKQGKLADYTLVEELLIIEKIFENYFEDDFFEIELLNIGNANYVTKNESFQIQIFDGEGYLMNRKLDDLLYETTNSMNVKNFSMSKEIVSSETTYNFELSVDLIPTQGALEIIFPLDISLDLVTNQSCVFLRGINFGATCRVTENKITFNEIFPLVDTDNAMSFLINNIMNPVSSKATDFFKFQITSTDEGVILDYTSSVFVEAKPSEILLKDANFNDPTVDTETMLSLTFENVHAAIPEGSYLEIDLQELDLGDIACFGILNIEDTNLSCQINESGIIVVQDLFSQSLLSNEFQLLISGVKTPRSLDPVCGIVLTIKAQDTNEIATTYDSNNNCIHVSNLTPIDVKIKAVQLEEIISFIFELTVLNKIEKNDFLVIALPKNSLGFTETTLISSTTTSVSGTLENDKTIKIIFDNSIFIAKSTPIQIQLDNLSLLGDSLEDFEFSLHDQGSHLFGYGKNGDKIIPLKQINSLEKKINTTSTQEEMVTFYSFDFQLEKNVPKSGGIFVTLPDNYLILDEKCLASDMSCARVNKHGIYLYNFEQEDSITDFKVNISNALKMTPNNASENLILESKDFQNQTIEQFSLSYVLDLICSSECGSCSGTSTWCTSCKGETVLFDGSCVSSCPLGAGLTDQGVCETCLDKNCQDCSNSWNVCLNCKGGYELSSSNSCAPQNIALIEAGNLLDLSFTVLLICLVSSTLLGVMVWVGRSEKKNPFSSFIETLVSFYSIVDVVGLVLLSLSVILIKELEDFGAILGTLAMVHFLLQVYSNLKIFSSGTLKKIRTIPSSSPLQRLTIFLQIFFGRIVDAKLITNLIPSSLAAKFLSVLLVSSLKSFFASATCFALIGQYFASQKYLKFFYLYGNFSLVYSLLLFIPSWRLARELLKHRVTKVQTQEKKYDVIKPDQDISSSIGQNKAKTLARDLDFTTLRRKFGKDFSEVRKLVNYHLLRNEELYSLKQTKSEKLERDHQEINSSRIIASEDLKNRIIYRQIESKNVIKKFDINQSNENIEASFSEIWKVKKNSPKMGKLAGLRSVKDSEQLHLNLDVSSSSPTFATNKT